MYNTLTLIIINDDIISVLPKCAMSPHQCRKFLAQPAIRHVAASLVLVHWNRNGISRACDLTAVFAIDHTPVKLHSDWVHAAEPRHF